MEKSVVEEMKYEDGQQNLSEAQIQAIADEVLKESKPAVKDDDWNNPADDQEASQDDLQAEKEANEKKEAERVAQEAADKKNKESEDAKTQEVKDAEAKLKADADKKASSDKSGESKGDNKDQPFQIPAESRSKLVEELALKESLTLEEAEAQIVKDEATVNKYKNDPVEMARALRHIQSERDKAKSELDATRKAGNNPPAPVMNNVKDYVEHQLEPIKEKVIESFKKEYPELCEGQADTYIYGLIKKDAVDRTLKVMEENQSKLVGAAKEKRANLILSLSDQEKSFLPDIKAILDRTSDRQIMAKDYDLKDVIYWARGKQTDRLVKEAEERGFKRGQEQPKILGEKVPQGSNKQANGQGGAKKPVLSDIQQERALNMFDIAGMTDQEKFDAYVEIHPEEFKK